MKFSLTANLVLNWVCPILSFPECFQLTIVATMCTIAINVFEHGAFNVEFQFLYPYLIKFHDFVDNSQEGINIKWGGAT
jgi:hypothetical protein